ncbi:hypothetical protein B6U99_02695 [Candidatus Geothermarchaeota archaeon ex4572_27]|nr:MAG: hypothetical protein B6U99_02695 [Candidatus Geothermarchaeota archaeon ex4572_27]
MPGESGGSAKAQARRREIEDKEMPFWDHVAELAQRLRVVIISYLVALGAIVILPANPGSFVDLLWGQMSYRPLVSAVLEKMKEDLLPSGVTLIGTTVEDPITLYFEVSMVIAFIVISPIFAYEVYAFVAPGLYAHEKLFLKRFVAGFTAAFIAGVVYAYYVILPITFRILFMFTRFVGAEQVFSVRNFYELVFLGIISVGLFFTLPVFIVLAVKFGLFDVGVLTRYRRYIYVAVFVITAILTPDPTPVSMSFLSIPFIVMYELSIFVARRVKPIEL